MPNITTNHAITYTNLLFHMWNYKIAMATFHTSQCQDGDRDIKWYHEKEDVKALKDASNLIHHPWY